MVPIPRTFSAKRLSFSAIGLLVAAFTPSAAGQGSCYETKLTPSDAGCNDYFGVVALDGNTLVVGAGGDPNDFLHTGSAYVFRKIGNQWVEQQKLVAPDALERDGFGWALGLQGNTLLVGAAYHHHPSQPSVGAVYAFAWNGSSWVFQQELLDWDPGGVGGMNLGFSLALRGDVAAIGSIDLVWGEGIGAVYVFRRIGGVWTQEQKLLGPNPAPFTGFGAYVAVGDNELFCYGRGVNYVYHWTGSTWALVQTLAASDQATGAYLGVVDVRDDWLISGSPGQGDPFVDSGAAYVFHREGGLWVERQKLLPSNPAADGNFGRSVAMGPTFAVLGASVDVSGSLQGVAYVFKREGGQWVETRILRGSDSPLNPSHDGFGGFVSATMCTVAVGALGDGLPCPPPVEDPFPRPGKAYVYEVQGCLPCIPALSTSGVLALTFSLIGFGAILAARRAAVTRPARVGNTE